MATKRQGSGDGASKATGGNSRGATNGKGRSAPLPERRLVPVPRGGKVPAQDSDLLTTAYGQRLSHTDNSLKAGERGPTLLEDFHMREKVMHFDHERIPERVVHARGVGVHGVFESYGDAAQW